MKSNRLLSISLVVGLTVALCLPCQAAWQAIDAGAGTSAQQSPLPVAARVSAVLATIPPIPNELRIRRSLAQATFCLPQNILGTLLHGTLQLLGAVIEVGHVNELTLVVTSWPIGVSLGKTIVLPEPYITERYVRHEYGHTLQGYQHGPFYLLLEGAVSAGQALLSYLLPGFADGYYERWPEDEANSLGGV